MTSWHVLPDLTPQKIDESGELEKHLHGLADNDLFRILAAAAHELIDRHPDRLTPDLIAMAIHESVADVHKAGFE